jgi:hypothetical protein
MTIMLNRLSKKTAAFQAVALVLVFCTASSAFANTWQNVSSIAGGFAVQMPGAPERTVKTVDLSGKPTPMYNFLWSTSSESFYVTYSDFPFSTTPAQLLTDVANGEAKNNRVLSDTSISVDGRPAKQLVMQNNGQLMVSRIVVDNLRVYQLIYVTNFAQISPAASTFLNSFRLTR